MKKLKYNKLISIYILWVILHFFLWLIGGSWGWYSKYIDENSENFYFFINDIELEKFYPFQRNYWYWYFDPRGIYDLSELLIYTFLPLLLFLAYKFWTKDKIVEV